VSDLILRKISITTKCVICGSPSAHKYCENCRKDKNGMDNYYNQNIRNRSSQLERNKKIFKKHENFVKEISNGECFKCRKKSKILKPYFKSKKLEDNLSFIMSNVDLLCPACFDGVAGKKTDI